jgi:hypothetical protein
MFGANQIMGSSNDDTDNSATDDNGDHDASNAVGAWGGEGSTQETSSEAQDISSWARVYLDDHPELVAEAKPVIESWFASGHFGKRAQKEFIKYLGIEQSQGERSVANGQS